MVAGWLPFGCQMPYEILSLPNLTYPNLSIQSVSKLYTGHLCVLQNVSHIIQTRGLVLHKDGGVDRSRGEYALALRLVLQGYDLVVTREDDLVLTDNGAAANGMDTDLAVLSSLAVRVTVIDVLCAAYFVIDRVGDHQRRT